MSQDKNVTRQRRHFRVRKRVTGTPERPRLNIYRSLSHIYAQLVDDTKGHTLAAASTLDVNLRTENNGGNVDGATAVGHLIAERAKAAGVSAVVFDRGGYLYHGRVKALAEAGAWRGTGVLSMAKIDPNTLTLEARTVRTNKVQKNDQRRTHSFVEHPDSRR